ncbi:apolipoprotein N-acyltransferase [methanotrophic endosymbiont of Bathymodiolus puteoserpentis (Logatchev)]|jgi:apolipoprotein N-acyltransferase|uniref:apolipoprotein N-acyltransferase n=1 Tax=methanotrophic endosymbiont of Bathymodiolus puteoserpentis (Logatchev) TaxID=343235 RepID=UPI0013C98A52|nr:apolipoprotein N-acyltransferase [methanotrophic endosymbiont of Bathymodiolus puteoserpentis (Logatchev)]SHE22546.1 Apolipoprotein N-acyltransferase / Copper homeostasis protein CutE [methanotrophic endosymbiont of Bathymodiolus puteoserpentis (Logatchev)]
MAKLFKTIWGDILVFIAGGVLTLSFSPFDAFLLAFVALAIFKFSLSTELSIKRAILRGFLFGFGLFGSGVSWVFVSMVLGEQSGIFIPILMTLFYCCFWAIFPAISAYLFIKLRTNSYVDWLVFSCVWVFVEYVRGEWVLGGFPWLQIGYSQLDSYLSGYIPIFGVYGVGLIIAMISALLADSLLRKNTRRESIMGVTFLLIVGAVLQGINWTNVSGDPIKVTLIQGNIVQKDKWQLENRNTTLKQYYDDSAKHWDSDIIIWPETAIPAYYSDVKDSYLMPLQAEAEAHNTAIITSLPYKGEAGQLYNLVLTLGESEGFYKKIHLLPFGEYLPWQPVSGYLLGLMNVRLGNFSSGDIDQPLLKAAGYQFVTSICYEDAFGEQNIRYIEQAKFLVNVTNDGWFDGSIEPYQHMQIARMRALESGRYLLRATNTGVTAIVSGTGKIIHQAPVMQRASITADIKPMSGLTPYARIGNKPVIVLILMVLLGAFLNKYYLVKKLARL